MPQIQLGTVQLGELCKEAAKKAEASILALEASQVEPGTALGQALARLQEAKLAVGRLQHIVKMAHVPHGSHLEAIILTEEEVEALRCAMFEQHEA